MEDIVNLENSVEELKAILNTLYKIIPYTRKINMIPKRPNSSPITEKIKSEWLSGIKSNWLWVPDKYPLPTKPPEPIAVLDWEIFQPAPSKSDSGLNRVITRCCIYGVKLAQRKGEEIKMSAIKINKANKGNPAKKTGMHPEANTINEVPRSGCL